MTSENDNKPVVIINGPTASGKSALALAIATAHNGVIINADSMQIYDALATLTAQPDTNELARAPHRLYGVLDPSEGLDAEKWRDMATIEIRSAHDAGHVPVIVGGTGFYIKTLMEGLSPIPAVDPDIRARGEEQLAKIGIEAFYEDLVEKDPLIDGKIDAQNPRRVMRAWEVLEATGRSLIHWQSVPKSGPPEGLKFIVISVMPDRDWLYDRCNRRFEIMFDSGAVDEVRDLLAWIDAGKVPEDALITKAIGFPEIIGWVNGETSKETAIESAQQATRNYAKRQMTWARNQLDADITFDPASDDVKNVVNSLSGLLAKAP